MDAIRPGRWHDHGAAVSIFIFREQIEKQSAAAVEDAATAERAMSEQIEAMAKIVGVFKIEEPAATSHLQKSAATLEKMSGQSKQ